MPENHITNAQNSIEEKDYLTEIGKIRLKVFIFNVSKNLVKIIGVNGVSIKLALQIFAIKFGIYDQCFFPAGKSYVALHYRQHRSAIVIERPGYL